MFKKRFIGAALILLVLAGCSLTNNGASQKGHIKMADAGWDSIRLHNAIIGHIGEAAYDLTWEEVPGSTPITYEALKMRDIDVYSEVWTDNLPDYKKDLDVGLFLELSINFDDNAQGIYVPTYVIEGDVERGIQASAPDLKTVKDLKQYADVFADDDHPDKGRLYGAIPGWEADQIMRSKWEFHKLDDTFIYFSPGSEAALAAAFTSAYEKGQPVVGYYWEPTWLLGKYDFTLLEDDPYVDQEAYLQGQTTFPSLPVTVAARLDFDQDYPEFTEFLRHYQTSSAFTSEGLAYMQDTGANYQEAALWIIQTNEAMFSSMMPEAQWKLVVSTFE